MRIPICLAVVSRTKNAWHLLYVWSTPTILSKRACDGASSYYLEFNCNCLQAPFRGFQIRVRISCIFPWCSLVDTALPRVAEGSTVT